MLLTSDKAAANFSDRSLLKNLGHWLGMITLAKNKPILHTVSSVFTDLTGIDMLLCSTVGFGKLHHPPGASFLCAKYKV